MSFARVGLLALVATSAAACAAIVGVGELSIGECKGGFCAPDGSDDDPERDAAEAPDVEEDAGQADTSAPCLGDGGPVSIRVGAAGNTFCIDSTEVTVAQYRAFVEAGVDAASQPPECAWNRTFSPSTSGADDLPVTGVDWCDAYAFCQWAGKYLCGKVVSGTKVGPVTTADVADYQTHQWMIACSAQKNRYPYGSIPNPPACNVGEADAGRLVPVKSMPGCEGSYPGVFDMVGNVWEWFDGPCRADAGLEVDGGDGGPQSHECWVKGGSFLNRGSNIDCRVDGLMSRRDARLGFVGFRCCSD